MLKIFGVVFSFVLPTVLFANEQDGLLLSKDNKGTPVALHAKSLYVSQFDGSLNQQDFFEATQCESTGFLDKFSADQNYMQASFFVVGDVRGSGTQPPYRTLPISTDGKRIIWGSAQSDKKLFDDSLFSFVRGRTNSGHSEPQFVNDMREVFTAVPTISAMYEKLAESSDENKINSLLKRLSVSQEQIERSQAAKILYLREIVGETLRTDPMQFAPFLCSAGNSKVNCYGFLLDSVYDICSPCLGELVPFIEDKSRCSVYDFMQQKRISGALRSRVVVHAAFPYIHTNYCLQNNGEDTIDCNQYRYDESQGTLQLKSAQVDIAVGKEFVEKDLQYPVVCKIRSFFRSPLDRASLTDLQRYQDVSPRFKNSTLTINF